MLTKFIEVTDPTQFNWGKFVISQYEAEEWARMSQISGAPSLLRDRGFEGGDIWVMDLQTRESACINFNTDPVHQLEKHRIWVCPMFSPFLQWLWQQDLSDVTKLPSVVILPAELVKGHVAMQGYRRSGPTGCSPK